MYNKQCCLGVTLGTCFVCGKQHCSKPTCVSYGSAWKFSWIPWTGAISCSTDCDVAFVIHDMHCFDSLSRKTSLWCVPTRAFVTSVWIFLNISCLLILHLLWTSFSGYFLSAITDWGCFPAPWRDGWHEWEPETGARAAGTEGRWPAVAVVVQEVMLLR